MKVLAGGPEGNQRLSEERGIDAVRPWAILTSPWELTRVRPGESDLLARRNES
jgi:hypothetical protein